MEGTIETLRKLGQLRLKSDQDLKALQSFVENENFKNITLLVKSTMNGPDGSLLLSYILCGLSDKKESEEKRFKLTEVLLNEFHSNEQSTKTTTLIVNLLAQEIKKFSFTYLSKLSDICVENIRAAKDKPCTSWRELLPKILNVLNEKRIVVYDGIEMSGAEYKGQIINTICTSRLDHSIITPLTSMFNEIVLTQEEHEKVVKKLCSLMEKVPSCQELPPLVNQLLQLCRDQHSIIVFLGLRTYFAKKLHNKAEEMLDDSMDAITAETDTEAELSAAENTILYHIEESAKFSRSSVMDLVKLVKASSHLPDLIFDPFILSILLSVSCIAAYETQVLEMLQSAVSYCVTEESKKNDSAWLCSIVKSKSTMESVLVRLTKSPVCEHQKVLKGLLNLSINLLSIGGVKGREEITEKIWRLGRHVFVSLVKTHTHIARSALKTLCDRIITGNSLTQFTECLASLCHSCSMLMVENENELVGMLEFLSQLPSSLAQRIVTALVPLIQISTRLRDYLILVLRKALFSREIETRKTAVIGFLQLLKHLKIRGLTALSQGSMQNSGPSVFSQVYLDVHTQHAPSSNNSSEAICLEVLGVLKKCFSQQAVVKLSLYQGLSVAIANNPELCESVLELLLDHFSTYYESDENILLPISLDKVVVIHGASATLIEPVGELLLLLVQVTRKANQMNDEGSSAQKCSEILDSLVNRFNSCELEHFQLDDNTDLFDIMPDSLKRQEEVTQILGCHEALMSYIIGRLKDNPEEEDVVKLCSLLKGYNRIVDYVKRSNKPGKKKDGEKGGRKKKVDKEGGVEVKIKPFKCPPSILTLSTCSKLLSLLYKKNSDPENEAITSIRSKKPLHVYAMQSTLDAIQRMKTESKSRTYFKQFCEIAKLLFKHCLSSWDELIEISDVGTAAMCLECWSEIVTIVTTNHLNIFSQFLTEAVDVSRGNDYNVQLIMILKCYKEILRFIIRQQDSDDEDDDVEIKKLEQTVVSALSILTNHFLSVHPDTEQALEWATEFAENNTLSVITDAKQFIHVLMRLYNKCKTETLLYDNFATQFNTLFGTINEAEVETIRKEFKMITEGNMLLILPLLCETLMKRIEYVDGVIALLKAHLALLPHAPITISTIDSQPREEVLNILEREVSHQLAIIGVVAHSLSTVQVSNGPNSEILVKMLTRYYAVITSLTKHFVTRATPQNLVHRTAKFEKLVKLAGSTLSSQIGDLLLHIEESTTNAKLKNVAKKQTIFIPKLVAELENFQQYVTNLSTKSKDTALSLNLKLTVTRDFRLNVKKCQEVLNQQNEENEEDDVSNNTTASSQGNRSRVQSQNKENDPSSQRPAKRRKTS
ncbi:unnamed protein product [Bemisia tabaci]|uniref:Fanconi anemia group I protein n=1 Tax=Bemisia tabaci TaxID=7038 RepID=A0A9P0F6N3_BEMTA|nr:unnamed protein product [Bemisia tabaci]